MVNIVRSFIWLGNPQGWGVGGGLKQLITTKGTKESLVVYSQNFARLGFSSSTFLENLYLQNILKKN